MTLSIERAEALVEEFCAAYPAASAVTYTIRETREELYGPKATREAIGTILGSFQPRSREAIFAAANFPSDDEFKRSLRHEILGHFGINTFNRSEKRALLETIMDARSLIVLYSVQSGSRTDSGDFAVHRRYFASQPFISKGRNNTKLFGDEYTI